MARLTREDVHVNRLLTNVGARYKNTTYIADRVVPTVKVQNQTDVYPTFGKSAWARDEAQKVAAGAAAPKSNFNTTLTNTYQCKTWKLAFPLPREVRDNADAELKIQSMATEYVTDKIMLSREVEAATALFNGTTFTSYTTTLTGTDQLSDYVNSDPIGVFDTAIASVEDNSLGLPCNTAIIGIAPWRVVRRHPEIIELCYGPGADRNLVVTPSMFAAAFELDNLYVGRALKTTDEEDTDDSGISYTPVWGDYMLFCHVQPANSMFTPSVGYNLQQFYRVRSWYDDSTDTDFIEASESREIKVIAADCGYLVQDLIA